MSHEIISLLDKQSIFDSIKEAYEKRRVKPEEIEKMRQTSREQIDQQIQSFLKENETSKTIKLSLYSLSFSLVCVKSGFLLNKEQLESVDHFEVGIKDNPINHTSFLFVTILDDEGLLNSIYSESSIGNIQIFEIIIFIIIVVLSFGM